jgi:hypothetical protein
MRAVIAVLLLAAAVTAQNTTLVARGATWKYYDAGSISVTTWSQTSFGDGTWKSAPAPLGYTSTLVRTTVARGSVTTYYRTFFTVAAIPPGDSSVRLTLTVMDGAVVYINGNEVARANMPPLTVIAPTTAASSQLTVTNASVPNFRSTILTTNLVVGRNCLAIEVHTATAKVLQSFIDADLTLVAIPSPTATASATATRTLSPSRAPSPSFSPIPVTSDQIATTSVWKYNDLGTDLGTTWRVLAFDDSTWLSGRGVLGTATTRAVCVRCAACTGGSDRYSVSLVLLCALPHPCVTQGTAAARSTRPSITAPTLTTSA